MPTAEPIPLQLQAEAGPDPGLEAALLDLLRLAAALGGGRALTALWDRQGLRFRAGAGLSRAEWAGLEPLLAAAAAGREAGDAPEAGGLRILASAPLPAWPDPGSPDRGGAEPGRPGRAGRIWALARPGSGQPGMAGPALAAGAGLFRRFLALQAEPAEQRSRTRGPTGSSFVPGLVHELRNFSFGISGSLDAFAARFGRQEETGRYERTMRASLEHLNAFLDELGDYGDPGAPAWTVGDPERVLRQAVDRHRAAAAEGGVDLRLELAGPLPPIRMDEANLGPALARLVGLAVNRQAAGGQVTVRAAAGARDGRREVAGHVEGSRLAFPGMDLARLFEPFYFRASGFGRLALPVARRVLERHGGSLAAEPAPGGGVRLAFALPALAP